VRSSASSVRRTRRPMKMRRSGSSPARPASSAASRATVRIVPSTGSSSDACSRRSRRGWLRRGPRRRRAGARRGLPGSEQELGEHHPGVAARTAHARLRHGLGHAGQGEGRVVVAQVAQRLRHRAQGEAHVRPGVAVGTGKTLRRFSSSRPAATQSAAASSEAAEPRPVHVADADARARRRLYSFTTVITTSGRTSAWILMPTRNSPSARIGSGRSMRRLSTCRPSSSSLR